MSDSNVRKDCCDVCAEADRKGGCVHEHERGKGMMARCCPPGVRAKDGCGDCVPCEGFHRPASAYFTTASDKLFKERNLPRPHQGTKKHKAKARTLGRERS